jgi:hypothetical protein
MLLAESTRIFHGNLLSHRLDLTYLKKHAKARYLDPGKG